METSMVWSRCELRIRRAPRTGLRSLPEITLNFRAVVAVVTTAPSFGGNRAAGNRSRQESHSRGKTEGRPAVQRSPETTREYQKIEIYQYKTGSKLGRVHACGPL